MALCILAGAKTVALAVSAFSLSWTHSVEKITWQENWQVTPAGLELIEARVKGSGAGMEPPEDAVLQDGVGLPTEGPGPEKAFACFIRRNLFRLDDLRGRKVPERRRHGRRSRAS